MKKYTIKDSLGNKKVIYAENVNHAIRLLNDTKITEKNLEDSKMKDSYIVKVDNDYIMESGRPEMTSFRKYAKQFNSEKEAIDYAKKYFKIRPSDINVIKE